MSSKREATTAGGTLVRNGDPEVSYALFPADGDECSGFTSAFGGIADMGGLAARSTRSQLTHLGSRACITALKTTKIDSDASLNRRRAGGRPGPPISRHPLHA